MNKPVLFLDIDGVLNSGKKNEFLTEEDFDNPEAAGIKVFDDPRGLCNWIELDKLKLLQDFVVKNDCEIVGVSSWFNSHNERTTPNQIELNYKIAEFLGIKDRFIGVTKTTGGGLGRGAAVLEYVKRQGIKVWEVLDDGGDNMYSFRTRVINGRYGLHPMDLVVIKWRLEEQEERWKLQLN